MSNIKAEEPHRLSEERSRFVRMAGLTDDDRRVLDFAALTWKHDGNRDMAIRDEFGTNATNYMQRLNALLDRPEAMAYAPVTVKRLRRLRDKRRHARSIRKLASPAR